ncbi:hypothetical protein [Stenotrophomonas sp.]|uniref:hypothetical protein n=1 Tax=Stenotrophomonas sp. TaxID=69392 RepID=UPI0028A0BCBD|nr:hypothetical protein [Stenotrophomonas sp.]
MPSIPCRTALNVSLQSNWALPAAAAVGAVVGGGFALAFQGVSNLLPGLTFGSLLGVGWGSVLRHQDAHDARLRAYQAHVRSFADYPSVHALLCRAGTTVEDDAALRSLSEKLEANVLQMVDRFNAHCERWGWTPHRLIGEVIRHFYLSHCADRGVMLLSKRSVNACYLVAAHISDQEAITAALNQEDVAAGTLLRRMHCPYLRVDLANERLADAHAFTTEVCDGEWEVRPAEPSSGLRIEPQVTVIRRRRVRADHHGGERLIPEPATVQVNDAPLLLRGPQLRAKLAELPSNSRTWRELERIEQDLAANRPCGHLIRYQGEEYLASDLHLEGRRCPGRNAWRLLHRRIPGGHELVDIVDPHASRH